MSAIAELDHLLCKVEDPDAAGAAYERLGFTVTPRSDIAAMGLANRLVLMDPATEGTANFIECMGVTDAARLAPVMRDLLDGEPGIRSLVLATPDAAAAREELVAKGHAPGPVIAAARHWVLPSGEVLDVAFDVILPLAAPLTFNLCQYRTLHHYLRPEWRRHANTARRMVSAHAVVEDVEGVAGFYARLFDAPPRPLRGGVAVSPGAVDLILYDLAGYAERFGAARAQGFAGMAVTVADLPECRRFLAGARDAPLGPVVTIEGNDLLFLEDRR